MPPAAVTLARQGSCLSAEANDTAPNRFVDVTFVHAEHQGNPVLAEEARAIACERVQQLASQITEEVVTHGRIDTD